MYKKNYSPSHMLSDVQYAKKSSVKNYDSIVLDKKDYGNNRLEKIQKTYNVEE
jgi:hypothetical protein